MFILNDMEKVDSLYFILYLNCGAAVILYENIKCYIKNYNSKFTGLLFLEGNYYKNKYFAIDKWYLTHLLFYGLLGYLYPDALNLTMTIGLIWEIFEFYLSYSKPKWFFKCFNTKHNSSEYWYGRFSDIFVNYIGFMAGSSLKMLTNHYM